MHKLFKLNTNCLAKGSTLLIESLNLFVYNLNSTGWPIDCYHSRNLSFVYILISVANWSKGRFGSCEIQYWRLAKLQFEYTSIALESFFFSEKDQGQWIKNYFCSRRETTRSSTSRAKERNNNTGLQKVVVAHVLKKELLSRSRRAVIVHKNQEQK